MTEPADTTPGIPEPNFYEADGPAYTPEPVEEPVTEAPTEPDPTSTATTEPDAPTATDVAGSADAPTGSTPDTTVLHRFRIVHEKYLPGQLSPTETHTSLPFEIGDAYDYLAHLAGLHDL
jgi:hypothetical protein